MATATHHATLIGIFETPESARRAVEELHRAGFSNNQITMVHHRRPEGDVEVSDLDAAKAAQLTGEAKEPEGAAVGGVAGAIIGGAIAVGVLAIPGLGAAVVAGSLLTASSLAAVAAGAGIGAVGGGFVGALIGLDFPEHEAIRYEKELKAGRALVGVHAGSRADEAWAIIRNNGGHDLQHEAVDVLPVVGERPAGTGL